MYLSCSFQHYDRITAFQWEKTKMVIYLILGCKGTVQILTRGFPENNFSGILLTCRRLSVCRKVYWFSKIFKELKSYSSIYWRIFDVNTFTTWLLSLLLFLAQIACHANFTSAAAVSCFNTPDQLICRNWLNSKKTWKNTGSVHQCSGTNDGGKIPTFTNFFVVLKWSGKAHLIFLLGRRRIIFFLFFFCLTFPSHVKIFSSYDLWVCSSFHFSEILVQSEMGKPKHLH